MARKVEDYPLREFSAFLEQKPLAPGSRRNYVAWVRRALRAAGDPPDPARLIAHFHTSEPRHRTSLRSAWALFRQFRGAEHPVPELPAVEVAPSVVRNVPPRTALAFGVLTGLRWYSVAHAWEVWRTQRVATVLREMPDDLRITLFEEAASGLVRFTGDLDGDRHLAAALVILWGNPAQRAVSSEDWLFPADPLSSPPRAPMDVDSMRAIIRRSGLRLDEVRIDVAQAGARERFVRRYLELQGYLDKLDRVQPLRVVRE